jgi:hypothetical protein
MARHVRQHSELEHELLRKSVIALGTDAARCADCSRTPLVGERVHRFDGGRLVCELCRMLRPETPERTEIVRGVEHGHAVRVTDKRPHRRAA